MADWQVGDLALCVKGGPIRGIVHNDYPQRGQIIEVEAVSFAKTLQTPSGSQLLHSGELPPNLCGQRRWGASRFIKVTPPEADEFDRETIALLTGAGQEVGA